MHSLVRRKTVLHGTRPTLARRNFSFFTQTKEAAAPDAKQSQEEVYISEPVGTYRLRSVKSSYEQILEIEVTKETLVEANSRMEGALS